VPEDSPHEVEEYYNIGSRRGNFSLTGLAAGERGTFLAGQARSAEVLREVGRGGAEV